MKFRTILTTAILAACLSFAGAQSAHISHVVNICEVTPGGVNTVDVRHFSGGIQLEYTFQTLPNGPIRIFAAITAPQNITNRKFMLPVGTYKMTVKYPNAPPVAVYPHNVVVKPYQVLAGQCISPNPLGRAEPVQRLPQQ